MKSLSNPVIVVVMPVRLRPDPVPGTVGGSWCDDCRAAVWLDETSQVLVSEGAQVSCICCYAKTHPPLMPQKGNVLH